MDIRFADHPSFQRAAAGMVGGALLFGTALHPVTAQAPLAGGVLGIAAGAVIAHGKPGWRLAGAGLALALLFALPASWPVVAGAAGVLALALAIGGPRGVRGLAGVVIGALAVLVAMWCALRIGHARQTMLWPALARTAVSAAAVGVVGALAMLPRHLRLVIDPVRGALARLPANLDAEVRDLCDRAATIWRSAQDQIADDSGRALVRDGVLKTLEVAARSAELKLTGPTEAELAKRTADLDQRIAAATDGEVKAQYQSARAALADQQRYRDHIRQGRERMIARMHNHVAALEKFELAATGLEAARAASAGAPVVHQLEALSLDVAASGDALAELELGEAAPASVVVPAAQA
ncbi:MAG TPA: hypothetical protein VH165_13155 [Kofleriaceae bacterium]|jgi:hypothetical protein|nr:hypothetical protein [Kofleriaceae bacterium]